MRSLELNLASRPFRNNTLLWFGYCLLAVAVVWFTAWNTVTFVETGRWLDQLRNTVGSVESRLNGVDQRERSVEASIGKHDLRYLATQTMRANEVIHRKAFSWTGLFNVLEHLQPYEVKMTSLRPIFGGDTGGLPSLASAAGPEAIPVSVDGVAKTVQAFFDFEDALIDDPHIDRIEPARSNRAKNGEIVFSLSFLYYPGGVEKKAGSAAEGSAAHDAAAVALEDAQAVSTASGAVDAQAGGDGAPADKVPSAPLPAAQPAAAPLPGGGARSPAQPVATATPRTSLPAQPESAYTPPPEPDPGADPARRLLFKAGERHAPPEGPIRPRPKDYQPPDPFKDKKKSDPPAKKEGDR